MIKSIWKRGWSALALLCLVTILIVLFTGIRSYMTDERTVAEQRVREAAKQLLRGKLDAAFDLATSIPSSDPLFGAAQLILGETANQRGDFETAIRCYDLVRRDRSEEDFKARLAAGEIHLRKGRLSRAMREFADASRCQPENPLVISRTAFVLGLSGRRVEAAPASLALIRSNRFSVEQLAHIGEQSSVIGLTEDLRLTVPAADDAMLNLANGRCAIAENRLADAAAFVETSLQQDTSLHEAAIRKAEILLLRKDLPAFAVWNRDLGTKADWHPDLWCLRGQFAELIDDKDSAIRCYWETIQRDPNSRLACFRLGQLLPQTGRSDEAAVCSGRAAMLDDLGTALERIVVNNRNLQYVTRAAHLTYQLGRVWEAWGWSRAALLIDPELDWALTMRAACEAQFSDDLPQTSQGQPISTLDLAVFPLPDYARWQTQCEALPKGTTSGDARQRISFVDDTAALGMTFEYFNSSDPLTPGGRMFEFTGGGIAAVDFDLDTRPDLYFVQGCQWPPSPRNHQYLDRLLRNRGDQMQDVTDVCGIAEDQFGQGISSGDVDQDGFPDLYIASTNRNRLFISQGDGTFMEKTSAAGLDVSSAKWTTSCLIADLNNDTFPDLYDVNYAEGDDVFSRICDHDGVSRACLPTSFPASADRLWLSDGQGAFRDVSEASGIDIREGRGLGIVTFVPGDTPGPPVIFVTNDMTENFLWRLSSVDAATGIPKYEEAGRISGVACSADGRSQASMGVGVSDMDGNGMMDLFVTNFFNESSNYFIQHTAGFFQDDCLKSGVKDISHAFLGFGCQCLDADLDGWPDVVVTNGHVDDFRHKKIPYQMRPQLLRNERGRNFTDVSPGELGEYFHGEYLGRALALTDWNNDRRPDFCVSHLDARSALVTNRSLTDSHAISFWLIGRDVERSSVGAIVRVTGGGRTQTVQVVGGGGYESSNDRKLIVGLGTNGLAETVEVSWADGLVQTFGNVAIDTSFVVVQGIDRTFAVPAAAF